MQKKLNLFAIPLRITSVIYALLAVYIAVVVLWVKPETLEIQQLLNAYGAVAFLYCAGSVVFNEMVIDHLKRGKIWAWIAGIIIAIISLPSIFFPLGICMLIALFSEEIRSSCTSKNAQKQPLKDA